MSATPPTVDIVIVNYQCADEIALCLQALGAWAHGVIWLVNNSASDANATQDNLALAALASSRPDVRLIQAPENLGFGGGCNLAFSRSQAEFVLLLNPDARIQPSAIGRLIETMHQRTNLGAVAPTMYWNLSQTFIIPHSVPQTPWSGLANTVANRWGWMAKRWADWGLKDVRRKAQLDQAFDTGFLTGAVLLIRRKAAEQAAKAARLPGGCLFDPDYFMFFEDSDLSLRLRRAGWSLAIHPQATAVHGYRHKAFKAGLMAEARLQYFKKQFPSFFKWSRSLTLLDALYRPIVPSQRFASIDQPVSSCLELAEKTCHAGVLALSPTMVAWPAFVRSPGAAPTPLTEEDWALMEPGDYVALLQPDLNAQPYWVHFVCTTQFPAH